MAATSAGRVPVPARPVTLVLVTRSWGEQVDAVAGADGRGGQQECCVHGHVEAGNVADAACRGTARVEDEQDPPVPLRPPGPDGHIRPARRGTPVDGTGVVSGRVVPQAVELGPLAAGQDAGAAVEFAEAGQFARQESSTGEGGKDADGPGDLVMTLAGGEPERAVRTDRDTYRFAVSAAGGLQPGGDTRRSPGGTRSGWRLARSERSGGQLLGGQASRRCACKVRLPGFVTTRETSACSPSRTEVSPLRVNRSRRTGAARSRSATMAVSRRSSTARTPVQLGSRKPTTSVARVAARAVLPVRAMVGTGILSGELECE